jgi:AcrR family transcriptional regulator
MTAMRDRFRAQVRDEVKRAALGQLAEAGPQGLSVNAIAKELGVSGPALYRYFASRDDLLTELIVDAYGDLADTLAAAVAAVVERRPPERLRAFARAYRGWAISQPHRYRLLFGPPLPGFDAHATRLVAASERSMATLVDVLGDLPAAALPDPPGRPLARQLTTWARGHDLDADPATSLLALGLWARLHGLVSLEISGNFTSMGLDAEKLFEAELDTLL